MRVIDYIKSDLYRYTGKKSLGAFLKLYLLNRGFSTQVWYRLMLLPSFLGKFAKGISFFKQRHNGIHLGFRPLNTGHGLYIGHNGPVVINSNTKIGNNVNLGQYTSIGSNSNNFANIGNNVYIGPNTSIVEGVNIGSDVTIGAGSVVIKDIPDGVTAAGNYAKVVNQQNHDEYIINQWQGK